jgi:preprotein translocase subunit YajC
MFLAVIAQTGQTTGGGGFMGFLPFILILVIIYFLMLRPQMKRQKDHAAMINALQKNDEVVTSGGLHGRIIRVNDKDTTVQLMIAKGIIVTVERSSIGRKKEGQEAARSKQLPRGRDEGREPVKNEKSPEGKQQVSSQERSAGTVAPHTDTRERRKPRPRRRPRRPSSQGNRPPQSRDGGDNK